MASEANSTASFPADILSAALDESGITDGDWEDFDTDILSGNDFSLPASDPVASLPVNGSVGHVATPNPNPADVFSQALKQLAATQHLKPGNISVIRAGSGVQQTLLQNSAATLRHSASSPAIIKIPSSALHQRELSIPAAQSTGQPRIQLSQVPGQSHIKVTQSPGQPRIHIVKQSGTTPQMSPAPGQSHIQVTKPSKIITVKRVLQHNPSSPQLNRTVNLSQHNINSSPRTHLVTLPQQNSPTFHPRTQTVTLGQSGSITLPRTQTVTLGQSGSVTLPRTQTITLGQSGSISLPQRPPLTVRQSPTVTLPQSLSGVQQNSFPLPRTQAVTVGGQNIIFPRTQSFSVGQTLNMPNGQTIKISAPSSTSIPSQGNNVVSTMSNLKSLCNPKFIVSSSNNNSILTQSGLAAHLIRNSSAPSLRSNSPIHIVRSDSPSQLMRSNSPVHLISQLGLSGGHIMGIPTTTAGNVPSVVQPLAASVGGTGSVANGSGANIKVSVSNKDLSRMWSNEDIKLKSISHVTNNSPAVVWDEEEVEEEVEDLGRAETYSEYMPLKLDIGIKHPDPVVESSSLSSVEPANIYYKLSLPESVIDSGELSALQLEAVVYSCQRHQIILESGDRAGFLIGDGAGVGKGRTVAGIIYENYLLGRKRALWLSVSNDLRVDAERDLRDIGAGKLDVHALNKFKYGKISSKDNGGVKKGVIFATYSSLIGESQSGGKYRTRLKQLLKWCGKDFDGVIVFDECHKAKNLCPVGSTKPTKTGQTVLELQNRLPKARIVYASATGASEPKNMAYMTRLGLWGPGTPFKEFSDFIQAVERRGVGAMELVAMDMKLRGMYIARQLSFHGVSFRIEEIPLPPEFVKVYNNSVEMWVVARGKFQAAAELIDAEHKMKKSMWGQFWSAHQRFFKYLCIAAKVNHCVRVAREAVKNGKCVVIGLQSTGEARTLEQLEDMGGELVDFVSTAKGVFQTLVEKHFPAPDRRKTFDIFGLGGYSSFQEDSNPPTPKNNKRKKDQVHVNGAKKTKVEKHGSDSDTSSSSSDSDIDLNFSDPEDSSSGGDDFNPFGGGSDSDDNPWLKKTKEKKLKKKVPKAKKKKAKKEKEKDFDEEFDKALAAAGLLKKNNTANDNFSRVNSGSNLSSVDAVEKAFAMKRELLDMLEEVGEHLPPNTLDQLIDELGGPDNVAEMTGRKGRVICTDEGISYESRSELDVPLEVLNLTEKQRFMDGEKNIAIISEAASSGISLQADRRVSNQRRRVHITLELPWSADRAIQQFGRTHRSNQVHAPEYIFLISELAGEQRFASTVAKRLESLGALTHGDRRATESRDLSRFNFDNKYGRTALESVMKSVLLMDSPLVTTPREYKGNFLEDVQKGLEGVGMVNFIEGMNIPVLEKDYNSISKFLNRILGMPVELQNCLFKYFSNTLTAIILDAKRTGRWDMGILDLGSGQESVKKLEVKTFVGNTALNTAKTELTTVSVERGMSWSSACDIWRKCGSVDEGYYISSQDRTLKKTAVLVAFHGINKKKEKLYNIYRPNTGLQSRPETLLMIKKKYKKVMPEEAQIWWDEQYVVSATQCSHAYWKGNCKKTSLGLTCGIGLRTRTFHVLSGSVLSVWSKVESVLASMPGGTNSKMQIIRLRTDDGRRIVGSLIPPNCVNPLTNVLSQNCAKMYTETHSESEQQQRQEQEESHLSMPTFF